MNEKYSQNPATVVRKKWHRVQKNPCAKKRTPVKKASENKNLFVKNFIFFVDKLNMIDFNIFNMLKLIFTCESVAYLFQNSFVNVSFNSTLFFFFLFSTLIVSLKTGLWSVCFILCCLFSALFFTLFPEIIIRLIFWGIVKPLSHDTSERLEIIMNIVYHLSWILWCIYLAQHCVFSHFNKQSAVSDFLKVLKSSGLVVGWFASFKHKYILLFINKWF